MKQNSQTFNIVKKISYSESVNWVTTQDEANGWVDTLGVLAGTNRNVFMEPMSQIFESFQIKGVGCKVSVFNSAIDATGALKPLPGAILWTVADRNGAVDSTPDVDYEDAQGRGSITQRVDNSGALQSNYMYLKPQSIAERTSWGNTRDDSYQSLEVSGGDKFRPAFYFGVKFPLTNGTASNIAVRFQIELTYYITFRALNVVKLEPAKMVLATETEPEIEIEIETETETFKL